MKNKLLDLHNHLFAQLERLSDEDLNPAQIEREAGRAKAVVAVSSEIIKGASLQLKAAELMSEVGGSRIEEKFSLMDKPKSFAITAQEKIEEPKK